MKTLRFDYKQIIVFTGILIIFTFCNKKVDQPVIDSVVPGKGLIGDPISLKGSHLENAGSVEFNGVTSLILNNSITELSTVVPSGATIGINKVVVQTEGGESNKLDFEVIKEPKITDAFPPVLEKSIPESNYIDYPVLIYGKYLSGVISITFNDIEADIFTNNQRVITVTVPKGVSNGPAKIKVRTIKGTSTFDFNVLGPPPNGIVPTNFSIVSIPTPNYIPLISNQWSCGLFSEQDKGIFVDLNSNTDNDGNLTINGKYEYSFDKNKDYNNLNYVEITNKETGEILAGQFSSEFDKPCVYRMVLISSITGKIIQCTVDVSVFGDCDK